MITLVFSFPSITVVAVLFVPSPLRSCCKLSSSERSTLLAPDTKPPVALETTLPSTSVFYSVFCFNDTATTEIYSLSLHDALPIYVQSPYCPTVTTDPFFSRGPVPPPDGFSA